MVGALRLGWAGRAADAPSAALGPRLGVAGRGTRTLGTGTPGNLSPCTWRQRRCAHQLKQCLARFNGGGVTSASESDKSSACDESSSCDECEQSDVSVYSDNSACVGGWGIETGLQGRGSTDSSRRAQSPRIGAQMRCPAWFPCSRGWRGEQLGAVSSPVRPTRPGSSQCQESN